MNMEKVKNKFIGFFKNDPKNAVVVIAGILVLIIILLNVTRKVNPLRGTWTDGKDVMVFQNSGVLRDGTSDDMGKYSFDGKKLKVRDKIHGDKTYTAVLDDETLTITDESAVSDKYRRISMSVDLSERALDSKMDDYRESELLGSWAWEDGFIQFSDVGKVNFSGEPYKYGFEDDILMISSDTNEMEFAVKFLGNSSIKLTDSISKVEITYKKVSDRWDISPEEIKKLYK